MVLGVVVLVAVVLYAGHLNDQRLSDIQANRIASCQSTYKAFLYVFEPFFPPTRKRTAAQTRSWLRLENVVQGLIVKCAAQTKPK